MSPVTKQLLFALTSIAVAAVTNMASPARGDALWDSTPYQVRVWIACQEHPDLGHAFVDELARLLQLRAESTVGAVWRVQASGVPPELKRAVLAGEEIPMDRLTAVDPEVLRADKVMTLVVTRADANFPCDAREFDVATQRWSAPVRRLARQRSVIPVAALRALADCFAPLGLIDSADDGQATVILRGGAMAKEDSPARVAVGDVMLPVVRRNDPMGRLQAGGISVVPWTLLEVHRSHKVTADCTVFSGLRRPLRGRSSYRTRRLAIVVRSSSQPTNLVLKSRADPERPLSGYQILVRTPSDEKLDLLGETDADGRIPVPPSDGRLQLVYVKSGTRALVRLPVLPGATPEVTVALADDQPRLATEAFLAGMEDQLTDLAVRRTFMAAQIRAKIGAGQVAEAAKLLDKYRLLPTAVQLGDALQRERAQLRVEDKGIEAQIDKLFRSTREKMTKYLDSQADRKLVAEVAKAKADAPE